MTDTTTPALLGELLEVDPETMTAINFYSKGLQGFDIDTNPNKLVKEDIIQGCIQRAIAEKGWSYQQILYQNPTIYEAYLIGHRETIRRANTPAAAILAAYIEAKRASR